jgi:DNA-binding NarL/FixJ family response regulator
VACDVIRLALVDDHPAILDAVRMRAAASDDIEVVGVAADLHGALHLVAAARPQVVLCDLQLTDPAAGGLELLRRRGPTGPAILFLSAFDTPSLVRAAFEGGAAGYLLKSAEVGEILEAVRVVAGGGTVFSAAAVRAIRGARRRPSDRELEVLRRVAAGETNGEIGLHLGLSEKTVESHLRRLFDRYDVLSRTELALLAVREGWIADAAAPPR